MKKLYWICSLLAAALSGMHIGCNAMLNNVAKDVTPTIVSGVLKVLSSPKTQRQLVEAIDEGRVKKMSARLSAGILDGVLDTLEDPARRKRLETILNGLTSTVVRTAVYSIIMNALEMLENPTQRKRLDMILSGLSATVAGTAVDTILTRVFDEEVQDRILLAMQTTVTDLITVVFDTIGSKTKNSEKLINAFGTVVHEFTKQATLGFQEALDDTRRDRKSGKMRQSQGALLIAANDASDTGDQILWTLGIGLAVLALGLCITLIWAIRKNRLRRSELVQRDGALLSLTKAIKSTVTEPEAAKIHPVSPPA